MTEMEKIIWKKVRSTFSLKKNFQLFCLSLKKLLLTFCVISWAFSKASDIPTPLNTLTIISLSVFKWWYKSTIHLACMGLIIDKRRETFTSDEAIPFLKAIDFGALMTFRSSGWNLLAQLCSMITISKLFLAQNSLKSSLSRPFNVSIITSDVYFLGKPYFLWSDLNIERLPSQNTQ